MIITGCSFIAVVFLHNYVYFFLNFQYFILDKKYGELLSQGQEQAEPTLFAKLMLSSVKPCVSIDVDRNFCFQVINPLNTITP